MSYFGIPYASLFNDVVQISYVLHLMFAFHIIFFALRLNLDGLILPIWKPLSSDNRRFPLLSIGLIAVIFSGDYFIPSIWDALQFTGATAVVSIGSIFPAGCRHLSKARNPLFIVYGGFEIVWREAKSSMPFFCILVTNGENDESWHVHFVSLW